MQEPLGDWAAETLRRHWREGQSSGFFLLDHQAGSGPGSAGGGRWTETGPGARPVGRAIEVQCLRDRVNPRLGSHGHHGSRFLPSLEHCPALRPAEPCLVDTATPGAVGRGSAGTWGQGRWGTSCEPRARCGKEGPSPPQPRLALLGAVRADLVSQWGSVDPAMPASAWTGGCTYAQSSDLGD